MSTVRKLIVEVVEARNLLPKDGHGTSSPYSILDFYGQRKKTRTVIRDLNPAWNETLEFNVGKPSDVFGDMLELDVFHDRNVGPTTRNNFLGRVRLSSRQFVKKGEEVLLYYPLEKKSFFSWIQGEIGLKIYFVVEVVPPPAPPAPPTPPPEEAKPEQAPPPPAATESAASPASDPPPPPAEGSEPMTEKPQGQQQKPSSESSKDTPPPEEGNKANEEEQPPAPPTENDAAPEKQSAEADVPESPERSNPADPNTQKPIQLDHLMASGSVPDIQVNGISGPQPISRVSSVSSFMSDASDRSTIERSC